MRLRRPHRRRHRPARPRRFRPSTNAAHQRRTARLGNSAIAAAVPGCACRRTCPAARFPVAEPTQLPTPTATPTPVPGQCGSVCDGRPCTGFLIRSGTCQPDGDQCTCVPNTPAPGECALACDSRPCVGQCPDGSTASGFCTYLTVDTGCACALTCSTPSPTPTPPLAPPCAGDCNRDRAVTVDEIVRMVNIALNGDTSPSTCPGNEQWCSSGPVLGAIGITCLIDAVNDALNGCPLHRRPHSRVSWPFQHSNQINTLRNLAPNRCGALGVRRLTHHGMTALGTPRMVWTFGGPDEQTKGRLQRTQSWSSQAMTSADLVYALAQYSSLLLWFPAVAGCGGESINSNNGCSGGDTKAVLMTLLIGISDTPPGCFPDFQSR